jgi:cytochrome P450
MEIATMLDHLHLVEGLRALVLVAFTASVIQLFQRISRYRHIRDVSALNTLCYLTDVGYIISNAKGRLQGNNRCHTLYRAHQNNPVLRLGPTRLSFAHVDAIRPIYGTGSKCIKGDQYTTPGGTPNILTVVDRSDHAVKRKRLSAAFAPIHLLHWEHKVANSIRQLLNQINHHIESNQVMEFRHWSNLFTLDAIMSIAVSRSVGFVASGSAEICFDAGRSASVSMIDSLRAVNRTLEPIVWSAAAFPMLKRLTNLLPSYRKEWRLAAKWRDVVRHIVHQRLQLEQTAGKQDDLFACLLRDSKGSDLQLTEDELMAEGSHLRESSHSPQ